MTSTILDSDTMREAAVDVLRRNDLGRVTSAAPDLYPHQWSWDAAFVAIGLSRVDVPRDRRAAQPAGGPVEHGDAAAHRVRG